ncbi:MAG: threonine/serine exporter family protein, partial [Clostridia bacterium]|nr:threonine/serine exporter family protein [Clostridia bacterium]
MNILHHHEQILNFAVKAGELMLKSGAETYRVEDTITRILQANPYEHIDTFVIPTGIIVTVQDDNLSLYT